MARLRIHPWAESRRTSVLNLGLRVLGLRVQGFGGCSTCSFAAVHTKVQSMWRHAAHPQKVRSCGRYFGPFGIEFCKGVPRNEHIFRHLVSGIRQQSSRSGAGATENYCSRWTCLRRWFRSRDPAMAVTGKFSSLLQRLAHPAGWHGPDTWTVGKPSAKQSWADAALVKRSC